MILYRSAFSNKIAKFPSSQCLAVDQPSETDSNPEFDTWM